VAGAPFAARGAFYIDDAYACVNFDPVICCRNRIFGNRPQITRINELGEAPGEPVLVSVEIVNCLPHLEEIVAKGGFAGMVMPLMTAAADRHQSDDQNDSDACHSVCDEAFLRRCRAPRSDTRRQALDLRPRASGVGSKSFDGA